MLLQFFQREARVQRDVLALCFEPLQQGEQAGWLQERLAAENRDAIARRAPLRQELCCNFGNRKLDAAIQVVRFRHITSSYLQCGQDGLQVHGDVPFNQQLFITQFAEGCKFGASRASGKLATFRELSAAASGHS